MKSINKLFALLLIVIAMLSACTKEMGVYEFVATPKPPAPPVRVPEVDPDDVLAAKITYLGETYNTQVIGTAEYPLPMGLGFGMTIQLKDKDVLTISLPLEGDTLLRSGKYILRNNLPVADTLAPYSIVADMVSKSEAISYFDGGTISPNYDFTLVMEIDTMNRETHTITGFIDTLKAVHKTDPTKNFELAGEFSFQWNYTRFEIDGALQGEYDLRTDVSNKHANGGWQAGQFGVGNDPATGLSRTVRFDWTSDFWNQANLDLFDANKGVGEYEKVYDDITLNRTNNPARYQFGSGSKLQWFYASGTTKVVLDNFNAGQFVKGYVEFIAKQVTTTQPYSYIANSPSRRYKVSFSYRKILY